MEVEKYDALGMDFKNLMSCIHYHEDAQDKNIVLETLKTIRDICSNESCGRDAFREEGGLDFLVEFLFETENTIFLEHTLKTLAFVIDENVHSQMYLSKRSVFEVLQTILKKQSFPTAVQKNALVLICTILYHNSAAQSLMFEIGFLQDLLHIYEQHAHGLMINSTCATSNLDNHDLNLWMSANSALCFAVNNPQNEKNQDVCKNIFPVALRTLEFSSNSAVMTSAASFLSLTISNNEICQDYFSSCDGFLVLKRCFKKYFDALLVDMKICNGLFGTETYQAINSIVGVVSSASLDHEKNASISGNLGILSMMVKLLFVETLECQLRNKMVLCLGYCIDACCLNKSYVLETENFDAFLKKSLQLEDAELSFACKYLLKVCLVNKGSLENDLNHSGNGCLDGSSSLNCNAEFCNDASKDSFSLNRMVAKIPPKQSLAKEPSIWSPDLKVKDNSCPLGKTYSSSSSSHENTVPAEHKRRKISKIYKRNVKKSSSCKKEGLFNSSSMQCNLLPGEQFSPRNKKYSASTHSNTNLKFSSCKSYKKELSQPSSSYFLKQDITSNKMSFSDFLTKETNKSSSPNLKNPNFLKTDYSTDCLVSDWHSYNKSKLNRSVSLNNNSTKVERISQNNINNSFLPNTMNIANQDSMKENLPNLFKKKKRISSKQLTNRSSDSSTVYSFTSYVTNYKRPENKSDSQFNYCIPYQSEIKFPQPSKNCKTKRTKEYYQNDFMKKSSDDELQVHVRKPLFSLNAENLEQNNQQPEFALKISPAFQNGFIKDSSFSNHKITPKIDKGNLLDLTKLTDTSPQQENWMRDSGFSSNYVSQSSRASDICLGNSHQLSNCTVLPLTSRVLESPYNNHQSWSCSSIGSYNESFSPFSSVLNSCRQVQVVVLPKETCKQHGLSASTELLEVVSLEDIIKG